MSESDLKPSEHAGNSFEDSVRGIEKATTQKLNLLKESFGDSSHLKDQPIDTWRDGLNILSESEMKLVSNNLETLNNNLIAERKEKSSKFFGAMTKDESTFDIDEALKSI